MLDKLLNSKGFAFDLETTGLDWQKDSITRIGFAFEYEGKVESIVLQPPFDIAVLRHVFLSGIKKIGANIKGDCKFLTKLLGCQVEGIWFDTVIAARLTDENQPADLKSLGKRFLNREWGKWKPAKAWLKENPDKTEYDYELWLTEYNRIDAEVTYIVAKDHLAPLLRKEKLWDLFQTEMEVVRVFYESELKGCKLNISRLLRIKYRFEKNQTTILNCMYKWLHANNVHVIQVMEKRQVVDRPVENINFNSSQQLKILLYNALQYPEQTKIRVVKSGEREKGVTTDKESLVKLAYEGYDFARWIVFYRYISKLITVIESLLFAQVNGRIYQDYNTCKAETGRFSEHYLQCIPGKTKQGREIRKCFIPDAKKMFVCDYSNIELRILASISGDTKLKSIYLGGNGDAHQTTKDEFAKRSIIVSRQAAKTTNFGIGYGMTKYRLMAELNRNAERPWVVVKNHVNLDQCQSMIDTWYKTYPRVLEWKAKVVYDCTQKGYVTSLFGRRRRFSFKGIDRYYKDKYGHVKTTPRWAAIEREAVNSIIQMSSADITKLAICALNKNKSGRYAITLQNHDELDGNLFDIDSISVIKDIMESVIKLNIPVRVDAKVCDSWGEK